MFKSSFETIHDPKGDVVIKFYLRVAEHELQEGIKREVQEEIKKQMESAVKSIVGSIIQKEIARTLKEDE